MSVEIKSFNQILGGMVRKVIAETPLSDVNPGSVFLSLLEACASQDFDNNVAILNILELLNVDAIRNNDLDNKAADLGLQRFAAISSTGTIQFKNAITKQSTALYGLKPAPISGQMVLFVSDATDWASTGTIYIGRGTNSFEGPISYTSIVNLTTYWQINLGAALQKDHLLSDTVVNAQGEPDRVIPAGTTVKIPANNQNPDVFYSTIRDAVIPAGEDHVDDVLVVARLPGSQGNASINTIRQFDTTPFTGATVTNLIAFSTGSDIETDVQLRDRIKSHSASLARGTSPAILSAVINLSDSDENKRVASATLSQPVSNNDPAILYIDDGNGFQPSQAGQTVDVLLSRANGTEEFLQLANYPLPRAQVINGASGPFLFVDQMFLRVVVDEIEETVVFTTSDFVNITVATLSEIVSAINAKATLFKARLTNDSQRILVYPVDPDAEVIQIGALRSIDTETLYVNNLLNFPVHESSYISLYKNGVRLQQRERIATVETVAFGLWGLFSAGDLIISVDGTPEQDRSFSLADFSNTTSLTTLSLENWVEVFNQKFAGITATATPNQTMRISSNKSGSGASMNIVGGTYAEQMFGFNSTFATGQNSQFEINRSNGQIRILTDIALNDVISAGIADAKGSVISTSTTSGIYNLDVDDSGRQAQMVVCTDSTFCDVVNVNLAIDQSLDISEPATDIMRIMAPNIDVFRNVQPGHFIYITYRDGDANWVSVTNSGLFKVKARGEHLTANSDTYIDLWSQTPEDGVVGQTIIVADAIDIVAFNTDAYPQLWTSSYLTLPTAATFDDLIESINMALIGVKASIFQTNSVKITSSTETNGSIAIPVSVGRASTVYSATSSAQLNDTPLIANKTSSKDLLGFIKLKPITSSNTYLNRSIYSTESFNLDLPIGPDPYPYSGTYADQLTNVAPMTNVELSDVVVFTKGNNKGLMRSIKAKPSNYILGTQQGLPRTALTHATDDKVEIFNSLQMAQDDSFTVVIDQDAETQTISIPIARTGQINGGSDGIFVPTSTEFSANDTDNEIGTNFSTTNVWGTNLNGTNFSDYNVLMRARNWYASGGTVSGLGIFLIRSVEYGVNGNKGRFSIEYPTAPNLDNSTTLNDTPSWNKLSYVFGSGAARSTGIPVSTTIAVTGPYADTVTNFPNGAVAVSGDYYDLNFSAGDLSTVQVNDVVSILSGSISGSGFAGFLDQHSVQNKSGNTIRLYLPDGVMTTLTVTDPSLLSVFPLTGTTVGDITTAVNLSNIMVAVAVSLTSATIVLSTFEDQYGWSAATALGYNHNPADPTSQGFVGLYDGMANIKTFSNADPNFTIKDTLVLPTSGVSPVVYRMDTAVNEDDTVGEYFKLVPTTVTNIHHHFTQKALSQLPIIADVSIVDQNKRIQIVSKELGGNGAIEVLGGQANLAQTSVLGQSMVSADVTGSYLLSTVSAFPNTYSTGDIVKIVNKYGAPRATQFGTSCSIDVAALTSNRAEYYLNPVITNIGIATTVTIIDVSNSYNDYDGNFLSPGIVWRWAFSAGTDLSRVKLGHQVIAFNCSSWDNTNQAKKPGDGSTIGFPVVAVDVVQRTVDVLNPFGVSMLTTAIGSGGAVNICPVPRNRWNLAHQEATPIRSISRVGSTVTVETITSHNVNSGETMLIRDSISAIADNVYGSIVVTGPTTFELTDAGSAVTELTVGATTRKASASPTSYRLQKLGANDLVKIEHIGGSSPRFTDCGVAVDDYLILQGDTFGASNNGTHRVIAVDNTSVIFEHKDATECLNTLTAFNKNNISVTWTANSNIVQGAVGAFRYLANGLWVKKVTDIDSQYLQVTGSDTGNYTTATQIILGQAYAGTTGSALGVSYDMNSGYETGVLLRSSDDILFYEGDSTFKTDTLNVQTLITTGWFQPGNTGQFEIIEVGNNTTDYRPFIRVNNAQAITETNISNFTVAPQGFYVTENDLYKYSTYRTIENSTISDTNNLQRNIYMLPDARTDKISETNGSLIQHVGKLGFDLLPAVGTNGYLFYTGLLRRAQRTIDGFAPDPITYTERRAVGSRIEILPPLIKNITLVLAITTNQGSTIQDISSNVKSSIVDYVNSLGVGQHVILSAIIAAVMKIKGVAAVTFNTPAPTEERITVASNEKALISADTIGII